MDFAMTFPTTVECHSVVSCAGVESQLQWQMSVVAIKRHKLWWSRYIQLTAIIQHLQSQKQITLSHMWSHATEAHIIQICQSQFYLTAWSIYTKYTRHHEYDWASNTGMEQDHHNTYSYQVEMWQSSNSMMFELNFDICRMFKYLLSNVNS